jgi:hypothetical protein
MTAEPDDKREQRSKGDAASTPPAKRELPRVERPDPTRRIIESEDPPDA